MHASHKDDDDDDAEGERKKQIIHILIHSFCNFTFVYHDRTCLHYSTLYSTLLSLECGTQMKIHCDSVTADETDEVGAYTTRAATLQHINLC